MSAERVRLGQNPAGAEIVCCQIDGEALVDFLERAQIEADDLEELNSVHRATLVRLLEAEAVRISVEVETVADPDVFEERCQDLRDCRRMADHIRNGRVALARRLFALMSEPELILPSEVTKWLEQRGGRLD